ncbi:MULTISPECIES: acetyltransferase [Stenotrophomonas]|uniref:Acetyltransferase n=1 Tax=Stenotrophomonas maltophilia TaxID=40324 RepID=A0A4S2D4R9_STEMA|nr:MULTISPECIES: acetyltransferase [Stenotrophomonas]TGY35861.1 acetyltransferase [Stenotrophomonas maltophilia]
MAVPPSNAGVAHDRVIAIFGAGGHARETALLLLQCGIARDAIAGFFVDDQYWSDTTVEDFPLRRRGDFDPGPHEAIVAIGDSRARRKVVESLPAGTRFPSFIHPSAITPAQLSVPEGVILHAGCILTTNIHLGRHVQLNRGSQVGHDSVLGDFVTTAPGAIISGNCTIGATAYLGAMSCIRERQEIGMDAIVGMGAVVVGNVPAHATYVGNPARPLTRATA